MSRRPSFRGLIERHFPELRKSQRTTIHNLSSGLVKRGKVGLAEIARGMNDHTTVKHRIRRAWRFARNSRVAPRAVTAGMVRWVCSGSRRVLVTLDWTALEDDYMLLAAKVAIDHRAVPIASLVMWKELFDEDHKSRNDAEEQIILQVKEAMGRRQWVLVADRGFARTDLFGKLDLWEILYVIRAPGGTWVRMEGYSGILDSVPRQPGKLAWYEHVEYRKKESVIVNLAITHREPAPEPWYLVTNLPRQEHPERIYKRRMWIEESFRDAKSTLGLKRLWLSRPDRMERIMILVAIAMLIMVLVSLDYVLRFGSRDHHLTTNRRGRTLSIFRLGFELIRQSGLPPGLHRIPPLLVAGA